MWNKIRVLQNTIVYLKPIQIYFQIYYRLKSFFGIKRKYSNAYHKVVELKWEDGIYNLRSFLREKKFKFINVKHDFENYIDWNGSDLSKLWNYNLNYFDYLNQKQLSKEQGLSLLYDFSKKYDDLDCGKDSYPTSLRIINWVKFIAKHRIKDEKLYKILREDAQRLSKNLEYHLLGNHLLENGFALWFAAHFFDEVHFFRLSNKILLKQLDCQILKDGGHFELSPMYHQLMLYRVLDCIQLAETNPNDSSCQTVSVLREKASKMSTWLEEVSYNSGAIPLVNDSANGINPDSNSILEYAKILNIPQSNEQLSDSGYRMIRTGFYELFLDIGQIGASYQPATLMLILSILNCM